MDSIKRLNKVSTSFAKDILHKNRKIISTKKLDKVRNTISGLIVSLSESNNCVLSHIEEIYDLYKSNELMVVELFKASSLEELWPERYRYIAAKIINSPCQGLGTPNASGGCGELFLLMTSPDFHFPRKGDIQYMTMNIEIKMGGKLGSLPVSGKEVNNSVVNFVKNELNKYNILPTCNASNSKNKGKKQFLLTENRRDLNEFLEKLSDLERDKVIRHWFNAQKLDWDLDEENLFLSWNDIKDEWLKAVLKYEFDNSEFDLICILSQKKDKTYSNIFKNYLNLYDFVKSNLKIENRAFQNNKITPYLGETFEK